MHHEPYAVILAGGRGERFWPYSTENTPKQLLALIGGCPLLVQTVERLSGVVSWDHLLIITSESIVSKVRELLPEVPASHIIAEPCGRNTAAAIATAAGFIAARDREAVFSVLPADHVIRDVPLFQSTLKACYAAACQRDVLITIGIQPMAPSTGYGYIEARMPDFTAEGFTFAGVTRFIEKPDLERARAYIKDGHFFWNAGMFVWSVQSLERAFGRFRPDFAQWMRDVAGHAQTTTSLQQLLSTRYARLDSISIDYAVMERADNIVMVPGRFGWDDVGTWDSLGAHLPKDDLDNAVLGNVEVLGAQHNTVVSEGHLTALIGVEDVIVVHTEKATLVCRKEQAERVKQLVDALRRGGKWNHLL